MLKRLSVENYALIDKLDIEFAAGLNIITGETGAGKSILLGAMGLILGNRADAAVIRNADRNCVVEGVFDLSGFDLRGVFEQNDLDYEPECVIRRVMTPAGKSRAYVNDLPVSLAVLKSLGERLIDIHSQHQSLLLGESGFQIAILDSVAAHASQLTQYAAHFTQWNSVVRERDQVRRQFEESAKEREYIAFQLEELQTAHLAAGEQQEQEQLLEELTHAVDIKECLSYASQVLEAEDEAVLTRLKELELSIGRLQGVYPRAGEIYQRLHGTLLELKDMASEIASEADRMEADPARQEQIQERLDLIYSLQQKHRVDSVEALMELQAQYEAKLNNIEGSSERLSELAAQADRLQEELQVEAAVITQGRQTAAPQVEKYVTELLAQLGMPSTQLQIEITAAEGLRATGADEIRFLFTANRNMPLQPVEKVASGGEMSRLMLALKALVASRAQLPTIIFDEIDTGVSGAIADRMGEIIVALAEHLQVINITHLPQVASKGDHHFFVYKEEQPEGTITRIRKLSQEERVEQIARMLSGSDVSEAALQQARLLLGEV